MPDSDPFKYNDDGLAIQEVKPKLKRPPLYKVILLNDDFTPMDFVIEILMDFFNMSEENMIAFIAKVQSDIDLLAKMNAVTDADGAIAIAKSAGFEITAGDLIRRQAKIASELSDDELDKVSGGATSGVLKALFAVGGASVIGFGALVAITVDMAQDL